MAFKRKGEAQQAKAKVPKLDTFVSKAQLKGKVKAVAVKDNDDNDDESYDIVNRNQANHIGNVFHGNGYGEDDDNNDDDQDDQEQSNQNEDEEVEDLDYIDGEDDEGEPPQADFGGESKENSEKVFRPPTNEELQAMKETEQLFKSNVFKLQTEELLNEVRASSTKMTKLETALHNLRTLLERLPSIPEKTPEEANSFLKAQNVEIPFRLPEGVSGNFKMTFEPPKTIDLIGSYLLRTVTRSNLNVDVGVQMPSEMFRPKDHLSYCYFFKRAYFLAVVASHLKKKSPIRFIKI